MTKDLSDWVTAGLIVEMAKEDLGIDAPKEELADAEIKAIMHRVGVCATQLYCIDDGSTRIGLFGVRIMLTICLLESPEYYEKYKLSQYN